MDQPVVMRVPWWKRLLALAITVGGLAYVFRRVDFTNLWPLFRSLHWGWLLAAVTAHGAAVLGVTGRWHLALRCSGTALHPMATSRLSLIGLPLNLVLFGPAGGDVAKSALYARWFRLPFPEVAAAAPLDRLMGGGGTLFVGLLALGYAGALGSLPRLDAGRWPPMVWAGLLIAALAALVGLTIGLARRARRSSAHGRFLGTLGEGLEKILSRPENAARGLAWATLAQLGLCFAYGCCLEAVGAGAFRWREMFWTLPVISLFAAIPSQAGLGVREGGALAVLALYGIPAEQAVSGSLLTLVPVLVWAAVGALVFWREQRRFRAPEAGEEPSRLPHTISVVIPAINEAAELPVTIARLRRVPEIVEIILVNGGSSDRTPEFAAQLGCRVLTSPPGRGLQMRAGAAVATGDVVLLLHADTWLEPDAGRAALNCFRDPTVVGGGYWKVFRSTSLSMLGSRFKCVLRLLVLRLVLGDQAMFIRRDVLEAAGGIPDLPLMEEFELCHRVRARGRLVLADSTVRTSARRFTRLGPLRTYLRMGRVTLQYYLGTPPAELRRIYERE